MTVLAYAPMIAIDDRAARSFCEKFRPRMPMLLYDISDRTWKSRIKGVNA